MKIELEKEVATTLVNELKNIGVDLLPYEGQFAFTREQVLGTLARCVNEQIEIIYYSKAIVYLQNNDASLIDSLVIAEELGYKIENINSELLATLHLQNVTFSVAEKIINKYFKGN